jgi:hypothetical protein
MTTKETNMTTYHVQTTTGGKDGDIHVCDSIETATAIAALELGISGMLDPLHDPTADLAAACVLNTPAMRIYERDGVTLSVTKVAE